MSLKDKIVRFICKKNDHQWVKISSTREYDTYVCQRCGEQFQIKKMERI